MSGTSTVETVAVSRPAKTRSAKRAPQIIFPVIWWTGTLFLSAGHVNWIRGWISVFLTVLAMTIMGVVVQHYNPGLLEAQANWGRKDTKRFDNIFLSLYVRLVLLQPALAGFDAERYRWSSMPFACVYIGCLLFVLSLLPIGWAMAVNPYAETSVRLQTDRGQTVITRGPYRFVRHPFYVGSILMYISTPLVWESFYALAVSVAIILLMTWRTSQEDKVLRRELPGYEEYAASTRYRLLAGLC